MPWTCQIETIHCGATRRLHLFQDAEPLTQGGVARAWRDNAAFRMFFNTVVADTPYEALFWETPAMTLATAAETFECIVSDAPSLAAMAPEPAPFARHFAAAGVDQPIATFQNLSGDAVLVAPIPRAPHSRYVHLARFCRDAPHTQRHGLWRAVGSALAGRLSDRPVWLNTSGLGVGWLHVRIDTQPKYYTFQPYRRYPDERA